jgi:ABC-type dipeptide/oligopeptide/nickel transport system permease subunit
MEPRSEYHKAWLRFRRNRPALAGLWFVFAAVFVALFGYVLAPDNSPNANAQIPEIALQAPGFKVPTLQVRTENWTSQSSWYSVLLNGRALNYKIIPIEHSSVKTTGDSIHFQYFGKDARRSAVPASLVANQEIQTRHFPLGTDKYGRCIMSRLILGFRVSLTVGLIAVVISLSIGLLIGALGGYFGGRVDDMVMLVVNTVWSIPTLLLVFAVVLALGRGIGIIFLAVGLTMWVDVAQGGTWAGVGNQTIGLRRSGAKYGTRAWPNLAAAYFAQPARSGDGSGCGKFCHRHPGRIRPQLPGLWCPTAHPFLGHHAQRKLWLCFGWKTPACTRPCAGHRVYRLGIQPCRQRAARCLGCKIIKMILKP